VNAAAPALSIIAPQSAGSPPMARHPNQSETDPASAPAAGEVPGEGVAGRLGEILLAHGHLDEAQLATVLDRQTRDERLFGELAQVLGYVSAQHVQTALEHQRATTRREVLVDFPRNGQVPALDPQDLASEALVAVRSQLVHRWFGEDPEQRALAVVSTQVGDGRSYVCSRLARLFAGLDEDTLLIDADLRRPSLHRLFGADNRIGLSSYLLGQVEQPPVRAVPGVPYLHLLTAGPAVEQPHRLIVRNEFGRLLERLAPQFRAIFIDTPAASSGPDALTVALRASGALLVVRKDEARLADQRELVERLTESTVEVVGAVINEVP
jgi:receptor protein-tyrosine kinase